MKLGTKRSQMRHLGRFPVMGLPLGQTNGDVFAAVEGCFMLFPCQGSHPPESRHSSRSRHAKWHRSFPVPSCAVAAPTEPVQGSRSAHGPALLSETSLAEFMQLWGVPPVVPAPPFRCGQAPLPPRSLTAPPGSRTTLAPALASFPGTWWRNKVQWQKGRWWDNWKGREASEPSLPPAAHRIRNYFSSIGNQVTSTWK